MTTYRIKKTTYNSGRVTHSAQVREMFIWYALNPDGKTVAINQTNVQDSRDGAQKRIDNHFNRNTKEIKVEFEYIDKS